MMLYIKLSEEQKRDIAKIQAETDCSREFECCDSGSADLCKVRYVGPHMLECMEMQSRPCTFKYFLGEEGLCKCPLRYYLAANLNI